VLLHGLILALILSRFGFSVPTANFVPVELVRLEEQATPPPGPGGAALPQGASVQPQQRRMVPRLKAPEPRAPRIAPQPRPEPNELASIAPVQKQPPPDNLEAKLQALAKLRQPESATPLPDGIARTGVAQGGRGGGGQGGYTVKDLIRAQVERRWSLDLKALGNRTFAVRIHVVLARDGTVKTSEVVNTRRYGTDTLYRFVAISARNAVLLSSPLMLPPGSRNEALDMVLDLNPRDTLR
jgi:hypothetical protein